MIIPSFWAEAKSKGQKDKRRFTVQRFGWSELSQADAQRHAEERVEKALQAIIAGEKLSFREYKVPYNGAEGVPIREEVISRHDDAVITRNSYGALCVNVPDIVFADMDFEEAPRESPALVLGIVTFVLAWIGMSFFYAWFIALPIAFFLMIAVSVVSNKLFQARNSNPDNDQEAQILARVESFITLYPDWLIRLYRTPAGFRAMVMQQKFASSADEVKILFHFLKVDPIYERMCERQACFRARVSPKPWRIGISSRMGPRPGVWPIKAEYLSKRKDWVGLYDKKSKAYASCRFVAELGAGKADSDIVNLMKLHDDLCQADSDLPLA
jgi:hypothetical protein